MRDLADAGAGNKSKHADMFAYPDTLTWINRARVGGFTLHSQCVKSQLKSKGDAMRVPYLKTIVAASMLLVGATLVQAQGYGPGYGYGPGGGYGPGMMGGYGRGMMGGYGRGMMGGGHGPGMMGGYGPGMRGPGAGGLAALNLTDEQRDKIFTVREEQRRAMFKSHEETRRKIDAILTPEQRKQFRGFGPGGAVPELRETFVNAVRIEVAEEVVRVRRERQLVERDGAGRKRAAREHRGAVGRGVGGAPLPQQRSHVREEGEDRERAESVRVTSRDERHAGAGGQRCCEDERQRIAHAVRGIHRPQREGDVDGGAHCER